MSKSAPSDPSKMLSQHNEDNNEDNEDNEMESPPIVIIPPPPPNKHASITFIESNIHGLNCELNWNVTKKGGGFFHSDINITYHRC